MQKDDMLQQIADDADLRRYFAMIPHMADDELDLHEYRLYGHYKRICGENGGTCEETERTTYEHLGFGREKFRETRASLAAKGYITIVKEGTPNAPGVKGTPYVITCNDVWDQNLIRYMPEAKKRALYERLKTVFEALGEHVGNQGDGTHESPNGTQESPNASDESPKGTLQLPKKKEEQEEEEILTADENSSSDGTGNPDQDAYLRSLLQQDEAPEKPHTLVALIMEYSRAKELTEKQLERLNKPVEWFNHQTRQYDTVYPSYLAMWDQNEKYRMFITDVAFPSLKRKSTTSPSREVLISAAQNLQWFINWKKNLDADQKLNQKVQAVSPLAPAHDPVNPELYADPNAANADAYQG